VVTGLTVFLVVGLAVKARRQRVVSGTEAMLGASAVVTQAFVVQDDHFEGDVFAFGEHWRAHSAMPLDEDTTVRVDAIDGLILEVSKEV
jgi:membrane-bound serine protease (ClpP class)